MRYGNVGLIVNSYEHKFELYSYFGSGLLGSIYHAKVNSFFFILTHLVRLSALFSYIFVSYKSVRIYISKFKSLLQN